MKRNDYVALATLIAYIIAVFYLCLHDFSNAELGEFPNTLLGIPIDKCLHFVMFLPLPLLVGHFGTTALLSKRLRMTPLRIIFIGLTTALASEVSQYLFTLNRQFELGDLAADLLAIVCGTMLWIAIRKTKHSAD